LSHKERTAGFAARVVGPVLALAQALDQVLVATTVDLPQSFEVPRHIDGNFAIEARIEQVVNFSFGLIEADVFGELRCFLVILKVGHALGQHCV
jgi:hypothetical protein